jgi:hypothetical protein
MTQRRDFLRQASLIAAGTLAARGLDAQQAAVPASAAPAPAPSEKWDMTWADRVTGRHRMVFDVPEIADGVSLHHARSFLAGYADTLGLADADLSAVLVVRHAAIPMVLDDELWADGAFAEKEELKDPATGEPARRNPFIRIAPGSRHALTWPDGALDDLMARDVIVLACDLALNNFAGQIARRRAIPRQDAVDLIAKHLLPGVTRMPSGVFATCHAQSLGCGVMASG